MPHHSPLTLYYIETRRLSNCSPPNPELPLLTTLRPPDQTAIARFLRLPDRHMSLASTLLKYLFIHRTAKIPWSEIIISRTPAPHKRPFWDPATSPSLCSASSSTSTSSRPRPNAARAVEFNVSHQAGLVALAGCATDSPSSTVAIATPDGPIPPGPSEVEEPLRIGIDITCVSERSRRPNDISSPSQFSDWVDIFAEVFSTAEMEDLKAYSPSPSGLSSTTSSSPGHHAGEGGEGGGGVVAMEAKLRRFYTFFALKEAYIKMTGEALLAGWMRELEFRNVRAPDVADEGRWGRVEHGVDVFFRGRRLEGLRVEVVGFGKEHIVALVVRVLRGGVGGEGPLLGRGMSEVDIERDVRPCAEGSCRCLDDGE